MTEYLGWAATGVFVGSYLCTRAAALKRVQMLGALMWVVYGVLIQATPVVAANVLVFGAAAMALARDAGVRSRFSNGIQESRSDPRSSAGG